MNKRIRELSISADKYANDICDTDADADWYDTRDEKLAQLIVRECIDWCNAHARDEGTAQRIAEDIKKDFGIEE